MRLGRTVARAGALVLALVVSTVGGCARSAPQWVRSPSARYGAAVALPAPSIGGGMPLHQAIHSRRSGREFSANGLPIDVVGQLLWAGQGVTSADGKRAAPSAGGLYPLELYVVTADEVMHYLPDGHRVERRSVPDLRPALRRAALGQAAVGTAPAVIVVAATPDRTRRKYGARADTFVALEAGHAAQNILLEATSVGLVAVPIGGLDPAAANDVLALPPDQTVLYLIPVGVAGGV